MAKKDKNKKNDAPKIDGADAEQAAQQHGQRIAVNAQYVKDLSFESPNAPAALLNLKEQPKIDLSVDIKAQKLKEDENVFEVALIVTAKASSEDKPVFICEINYGGIFTLGDINEQEREVILLVYCPSILFPFVRRVIADATRDGGFPPLMLDPVDFGALYQARKQQAAQQQQSADTGSDEGADSVQAN